MAKKKQTDVELCFEDALKELEGIVVKLEGGKLGLEESLQQYEQGVQFLKQCYQLLRHAERRIELVSGLDADGKAKTVPLDEDDDPSLAAKAGTAPQPTTAWCPSARSRRRSAERTGSKRPATDDLDDESSLF